MNRTLILVVEDDIPVQNLMMTTLKAHDYKYHNHDGYGVFAGSIV